MITVNPAVAPDAVQAFLQAVRPAIDAQIGQYIDGLDHGLAGDPGRLREGMRYAALGPGKRLRPALTVAACLAAGGEHSTALPAAAAIEMLHAYTLVHDDLPALDNDDIRRGRATLHIEFGEAFAILVGDALLTAAFAALADLGPGAAAAVAVLGRRAGAAELIAGQAMDLTLIDADAERRDPDFETLEAIHRRKTGALFAAAAELGGIAAGADGDARGHLARFGMNIGIAFQYADDRDDGEHGRYRERARARSQELTDDAVRIAASFGERGRELSAIAAWIAGVS